LMMVLDGTDAALWEWHVPSDRVTYNKLLLRLVGMTEEQLGTTGSYWNTLIHPEDRERTIGLLQDSVEGRAQHFASEYRIATGSGGWLWVYGTGKVLERDAAGMAVRMAGMLLDVSLRRNHGKPGRASMVLQAFLWVVDRLKSSPEDSHEGHGSLFADSRPGRPLVC